MAERKYDIVLFGSTGFTGRLVAEYFAQHVPLNRVKWALAGRNPEKLEAVKAGLVALEPSCEQVGLLHGDSNDLASLEQVTAQTRIIVTTVGPFALYGEKLAEACVHTGTHYCDITGEPEFVKTLIRKYDAQAKEKGVYLINCCGFDSIPADAGAYFTALQLPANESKTIRGFMSTNASFSGGTFASAIHALSDFGKGGNGAASKNPSASKNKKRVRASLYFEKALNRWALTMPVIDPWMVMRTAQYRKEVFGEGFEYAQFLAMKHLSQVLGLLGIVGAAFAGAKIPAVKERMLQYRKSGEGPSKEQRDKSYFKVIFIGESETARVMTKVSGGDPGYTETSKMLSETALTLLENLGKLPVKGGVLTPAGTLGSLLIDKLRARGIRFEVVE